VKCGMSDGTYGVFILSKFHSARFFYSKKFSTEIAKCQHLLVSTSETNDLFDRLQCITWQNGVLDSSPQFWHSILLLVKHCLSDNAFCVSTLV